MKRKVLFLFFVVLMASCSSDSDGGSTSDSTVLLQRLVRESATGTTTVNYTYEGRKMKTTAFGTWVQKFYYTGNNITKAESYNNNVLTSVFTFEYDSSEKLAQFRLSSPNIGREERETYRYNDDNTISVNHYESFDGGTEFLKTLKYFLDTEGEIIRIERYEGSQTAVSLYTYDSKNNPFKNVIGFDKMLNTISSQGIKHNMITANETFLDGSDYVTEKTITYTNQEYPKDIQFANSSTTEHYYY